MLFINRLSDYKYLITVGTFIKLNIIFKVSKMFRNHFLIILILAINAYDFSKVCFDQYGCFSDEYPFSGSLERPISFLPNPPAKINTTFTLYNKLFAAGLTVNASNLKEILSVPLMKIKFLVHGFLSNTEKSWIAKMKDELLKLEDCNVITVDWSQGAQPPYTQAVRKK